MNGIGAYRGINVSIQYTGFVCERLTIGVTGEESRVGAQLLLSCPT